MDESMPRPHKRGLSVDAGEVVILYIAALDVYMWGA